MSARQNSKDDAEDRVFLPGRKLSEWQLYKRAGIVYVIGLCLVLLFLGVLGVPQKYVFPILLVASAIWVGVVFYFLRRRDRLGERAEP